MCSSDFETLGHLTAAGLGMHGLPLVVVPHPLHTLEPDVVRARADAVIDDIVRVLSGEQ